MWSGFGRLVVGVMVAARVLVAPTAARARQAISVTPSSGNGGHRDRLPAGALLVISALTGDGDSAKADFTVTGSIPAPPSSSTPPASGSPDLGQAGNGELTQHDVWEAARIALKVADGIEDYSPWYVCTG